MKVKSYFVYIIKCMTTGKYYTGMSDNYIRRIEEHSRKKKSSTKYTKYLGPFIIAHLEELKTRDEARKREKFWKSGIGREIRNQYFI